MLTPAKITNHHFEASGRNAYKAESVDSFISEVAESYEQMFRENGEMFKKINLLAQRLEEYRNDEDNIRNALLTAQRAAEKITKEAHEKAEQLVAEVEERTNTEHEKLDNAARELLMKAQNQADAIIREAQEKATGIVNNAINDSKRASVEARSDMVKEVAALETMKQEISKFKQQILSQYAAQIELIQQLPEIAIEAADEPVAEEATVEVEEAVAEDAAVEEEVAQEAVVEDAPTEEPVVVEKTADKEPVAEAVVEKSTETTETVTVNIEDELDVEKLQELIDETEEESEEEMADEDEAEEINASDEFVVPDIDEPDDEELEKIVDDFDEEELEKDDEPDEATEQADDKEGFKLRFENIDSYADSDSEGNYLDDLDDDDDDLDDDDNAGLAAKLKGFFRK